MNFLRYYNRVKLAASTSYNVHARFQNLFLITITTHHFTIYNIIVLHLQIEYHELIETSLICGPKLISSSIIAQFNSKKINPISISIFAVKDFNYSTFASNYSDIFI